MNDFLKYIYEYDGDLNPDETMNMMNNIEKEDIEDYLKHLLHERELKKSSINKSISSLKSLYKELEKNGCFYYLDKPFRREKLLAVLDIAFKENYFCNSVEGG